MMKKKVWSMVLVLLALLMCTSLIACQEPEEPPSIGGGTIEGEEGRIPVDYLPQEYWLGEDGPTTFHILQWSAHGATQPGSGWIAWEEGDVLEIDGGRLSEAVFNRNARVEEKYGITITADYGQVNEDPTFSYLVMTNNQSGDDEYQLVTIRALELFPLIENDYLVDLTDYEQYIRTEQPWWVQDSVESYRLGEHLYAACSEMLLRDKGATAAMFFNRGLAEDYALNDFFELTRKKQWTMEEMLTSCEAVAHPEEGDLVDSVEDVWGMFGADEHAYYFYNGVGYKFARPNEDGTLEAEFGENGQSVVVMQEIMENVLFADWYFNAGRDKAINPDGLNLFTIGNALFSPGMIQGLPTKMEGYGVLPMPLYDQFQDDYSSLVWEHYDSVAAIPAASKNPEFCAVIFEALSWEAYYSLSPIFYEDILFSRGTKDEESKEMLQLILATRSYDAGQYWGQGCGLFSTESGVVAEALTTGSADIASSWASYGDAFKKKLTNINNIILGRD